VIVRGINGGFQTVSGGQMQPTPQLDAKGFLRSLYDFSFTSLITTKIIRFVYALLVIVYSVFAVIFFIAGLASGKPAGVFLAIIGVPIGYLIYVIILRIWMEILIVVFRIGDDVHAIRVGGSGPAQSGGVGPGDNAPPPPGMSS
jgi:hypothetical protein